MRGLSTGGGGGLVDMILKIAPIACTFFAFLFMGIALSSGMKPNYLEGLSIINFNMSTLGKNLLQVPDISDKAKGGCNKAGNAINDAANKAGDVAGDVIGFFGGGGAKKDFSNAIGKAGNAVGGAAEDACNKGAEIADQAVQLTEDVVDKALGSVAKAIGIKEYYSLHIGALCEGEYQPLFSDKDAKPEVAKCTPKFKAAQTDLSKKLDEELQVGPFKFKLSDLGLVEGIQKAFDLLPRALAAMGFFFLFAVLAIAAGFLFSIVTLALDFFMQKFQKFALLGALGFTGFGWFTSLIGVVGVTVVAEKVKGAVNKEGNKFGMSAATSPGLYFLLWASLVFSTFALALLALVWWRMRSGKGLTDRKHYAEKNQPASSMDDAHGFYQEPINGGAAQPTPDMYGQHPGRY
ncbi:hypothetical protein VTI74DRAFT_8499 [Chaetomium olivicolor]